MIETSQYAGLAADELVGTDPRPPLVLLHGLTFDRRSWRPAVTELQTLDPGRRVVAFDLPGHGESDERESYRFDAVVEDLHRSVLEAGLESPILVGHSISSAIATIYATRYPTSGVVNVDGQLFVQPVSELLHSLAPRIEGEGFDEVWRTVFWPSMHTELLPLWAQELLEETSRPRRELVVGYWRDILDRSAAQLAARVAAGLSRVRERGTRYLIVSGDRLQAGYRQWLATELPQARLTVIPRSGHFPQLGDPRLFAECLVAFAGWPAAWSYALAH
jgi:pimeloyl-ACP methyl ester carboxylesterase